MEINKSALLNPGDVVVFTGGGPHEGWTSMPYRVKRPLAMAVMEAEFRAKWKPMWATDPELETELRASCERMRKDFEARGLDTARVLTHDDPRNPMNQPMQSDFLNWLESGGYIEEFPVRSFDLGENSRLNVTENIV